MNDSLGDRMKEAEGVTRMYLPKKTNIMLRLDGKAFHSYTKHCKRPFDDELIDDMNSTAMALCKEIQGVKLAYVQSDEITIWATDYDGPTTTSWFDGNIQKVTSVSASVATAEFNKRRLMRMGKEIPIEAIKFANFDSRAWTISQLSEVANTFLWRCQDASRNSIQMLARSMFSHRECENKNTSQLQDMTMSKGINWNDLPSKYRRGRIIIKQDDENPARKILGRKVWTVADLSDFNYAYWINLIKTLAPKTTE